MWSPLLPGVWLEQSSASEQTQQRGGSVWSKWNDLVSKAKRPLVTYRLSCGLPARLVQKPFHWSTPAQSRHSSAQRRATIYILLISLGTSQSRMCNVTAHASKQNADAFGETNANHSFLIWLTGFGGGSGFIFCLVRIILFLTVIQHLHDLLVVWPFVYHQDPMKYELNKSNQREQATRALQPLLLSILHELSGWICFSGRRWWSGLYGESGRKSIYIQTSW